MDTIDRPFLIELNGKPIVKVVDNGGDERPHARTVGNEPAVFTLRSGELQHEEWLMGRWTVEDRSINPKRVLWFRSGERNAVQPVSAVPEGDSIQLQFRGRPLMAAEDRVFVQLMDLRGNVPCISQDFLQ
jgi:hypothetical protein